MDTRPSSLDTSSAYTVGVLSCSCQMWCWNLGQVTKVCEETVNMGSRCFYLIACKGVLALECQTGGWVGRSATG